MKDSITALFVGLGSIGSRHIKNLTAECERRGISLRCDALRGDLTRQLRDGVAELLYTQFITLDDEDALPHYDIAFITNPTSIHAETLMHLKGRADALFIEKPIFSAEQTEIKLGDCLAAGQKAYVAAPMRWSAVMMAVKKYLGDHPDKRIYNARSISSSYLPDWRPGVDYRTVYSAKRELGGGVTIDLIHEWDYLVYLFGMPQKLYNLKGTYSELEIDSDDLSVYIAQYPDKLVELHLDYFGRKSRRSLELFMADGTLTADFIASTVTYPDGSVEEFSETTARWYEREMSYFLSYAIGDEGDSINTPEEALDVLRLTLGKTTSKEKTL